MALVLTMHLYSNFNSIYFVHSFISFLNLVLKCQTKTVNGTSISSLYGLFYKSYTEGTNYWIIVCIYCKVSMFLLFFVVVFLSRKTALVVCWTLRSN